jgi:two-component system, chemotaxis family, response regulator Rcp1
MSPKHILVIEDNQMDVVLLRYAFERHTQWPTTLTVLGDGEEAIKYFEAPGNVQPDLVILDLNLPKRDGIEVLRTIRRIYSPLPVIVFSSSPEDVISARIGPDKTSAECYFTKPLGLDGFEELPRRFQEWHESVVHTAQCSGLPSSSGSPQSL